VRMDSDLVPLLEGVADGRLDPSQSVAWSDAGVCVVMASGGYPRSYPKGKRITGIEEAESDDVVVFHAGTALTPDGGFETHGGRVLGVTARGESVREAVDRAYAAVGVIHFEGAQWRRDIAKRALDR